MNLQHELHNGVNWFMSGADTHQLDNVLVVKPLHHLRLAQEVDLLIHSTAFLHGFNCHSNLRVERKFI